MSTLHASAPWDLGIIGSGSAAFAAALEARARGASVVLIERDALGGTCVNVGCVPSKALLVAAHRRSLAASAYPGLGAETLPIDHDELAAGVRGVVSSLVKRKYRDLAERMGIDVRYGTARFVSDETVSVDGDELTARRWIIATGAHAVLPSVDGLDPAELWTSTDALTALEIPARVAIIGAGSIGLELATAYSGLAARVHLIESTPQAVASAPLELTGALVEHLRASGVAVALTTTVGSAQATTSGWLLQLQGPEGATQVEVDRVIAAVGRRPTTEDLGLETVGVELGARGEVVVDATMRTSNRGIWAAGDVTGGPQYVYVAAAQGALAARNALSDGDEHFDDRAIPAVVFTDPPLAQVGLTLDEARHQGYDAESTTFSFADLPRAIVEHATEGLAVMVAERTSGRLLGVHLWGVNAAEVIQSAVLALRTNLTISDLATTWAPYLTASEALRLAAQSFTTDVANLSCCA